MTNELLLMVENEMPFSAVAVLHYQYYTDVSVVEKKLQGNDDVQCIVGAGHVALGTRRDRVLMTTRMVWIQWCSLVVVVKIFKNKFSR